MSEQPAPREANRLIHSTSPYLLQHAHNPVDWYPWGEEALARARAEDKPILLSIGYSACHWCHVMERESFEDESIAALMNESFVCIKVDREERPDLDDIYMAATLAMNHGQGGWPMTVFLSPEQEPFFAGTYFPPEDRYGRPGFPTVLTRIAGLWREDRERLRGQAAEIVQYLRRAAGTAPGASVGEAELRAALDELAEDFDGRFGGFGSAPKFPPATALLLLLRLHRRFGDARALEMARKTLDEMARGGMYDQIGGGFHRYSVDERWLVPHFEKMLYDNAVLARAYVEAHQATGDPFYRRIATEVLEYVGREMTSPEGGFYSATDADSEGEEGKFFVWTPEEIEALLGEEDARVFCAYYDISERGNWEGKSIANTSRTGPGVAGSLGLDPDALDTRIGELRAKVYEARRKRVPPGLDDKVLTAWNGLMIGAFAETARVFGDDRWRGAAERAADFVLSTLVRPDGGLLRTSRAGRAHLDAYLEDYAYLSEGLIDLYEAGGAPRYLQEALRLAERMRADFEAEDGGFYSTAVGHEALIVRHREGHDGATPSANAAAAHALARLSFHFDRADLRASSEEAIRAYARGIARQPRAFAKSLLVVDLLLEGPVELAFLGGPGFEALRGEVARHYLPNRIVAHHDPAAGRAPPFPLLAGKEAVGGRAALYVCRNFACLRPVTDPTAVSDALVAHAAPDETRRTIGARVPGAATAEATRGYASRFPPEGYTRLGSTDLSCSRVGFGGYRVDEDTPEHREALRLALVEGCNLIDTSTNYTDGSSERLIGEVLAEQAEKQLLPREGVIVVSKIGYVQGENLRLVQERAQAGNPYPEVVEYGEGIWHCIHREFLADQLGRSLDRLHLETLDVCLLHNPEYFLKDAHERSHGKLASRRAEFDRRIGEAFRHLETEVERGRIRYYGVSSNTFGAPAHDPEGTSLTRMLALAREAGGKDHRFRVVQLPLNLFESGPGLEKNNDRSTVLEVAAREGIGVLANRPLNAMAGESLLRLANVEEDTPEVDLDEQIRCVRDLEAAYRDEIASQLRTSPESVPPAQFFRWGEDLADLPARLHGLEHWEQVHGQYVLPRLLPPLQALDRALLSGPLAGPWSAWRDRYVPELQKLLGAIRARAAEKSRQATRRVSEAIDPLLPPERRDESLSRKALWVVASTPGVSCALNGMRTPAYVRDALGILSWPPLADVLAVYRAVGRA